MNSKMGNMAQLEWRAEKGMRWAPLELEYGVVFEFGCGSRCQNRVSGTRLIWFCLAFWEVAFFLATHSFHLSLFLSLIFWTNEQTPHHFPYHFLHSLKLPEFCWMFFCISWLNVLYTLKLCIVHLVYWTGAWQVLCSKCYYFVITTVPEWIMKICCNHGPWICLVLLSLSCGLTFVIRLVILFGRIVFVRWENGQAAKKDFNQINSSV